MVVYVFMLKVKLKGKSQIGGKGAQRGERGGGGGDGAVT